MTILRGRLSYLVHYHFSVCLLRPVAYSVCGCMLSVCVCVCVCARRTCLWDVWSWTTRHPTDRYVGHTHTHTHRQHTATYRISNWTKQTSGEVVMHKVRKTTAEDGHTVMTETCTVLMMFLQNIFKQFSVLICGCESVFKRSAWVGFE
jgi:hypothetical protein